jgi:hypothetical protein
MEKEIYLTEALYASDINETAIPLKEKAVISPFQSRPESAKVPSKKINNNFLPESYYDDKRVKPGISLYKVFLSLFSSFWKSKNVELIINTQAHSSDCPFHKLFS